MISKRLGEELRGSPTSFGTVLQSGSPRLTQALGNSPLDILMIEREHTAQDLETIEQIICAADLNDVPTITTVHNYELGIIGKVLDMGAQGIIVPQVETASDVEAALSHVHYDAGRSCATLTRAGEFGGVDKGNYIDFVNSELMLIPKIETQQAVRNLEEIMELQHISSVVIGPNDLSIDLDTNYESSEFRDAIDRIFDVANRFECSVGTHIGTLDDLDRYPEPPAYAFYGSDITLVMQQLHESLS